MWGGGEGGGKEGEREGESWCNEQGEIGIYMCLKSLQLCKNVQYCNFTA